MIARIEVVVAILFAVISAVATSLQAESERSLKAVLTLEDDTPAANVEVEIKLYALQKSLDARFVESDQNGTITLSGEQLSDANSVTLCVQSKGLAFAPEHRTWQRTRVVEGKTDLGTLKVVPGGGIRLRTLLADGGEPLSAQYSLKGLSFRVAPELQGSTGEEGDLTVFGLPVGDYRIILPAADRQGVQFWQAEFDQIRVVAGEVVDLGDVGIEPHRQLKFEVRDEAGKPVEDFRVGMSLVKGTAAEHIDSWAHSSSRSPSRLESAGFGKNGTCVVPKLMAATWYVAVIAEGYATASFRIDVPQDKAHWVMLKPGGHLHFDTRVSADDLWVVHQTAPCHDAVFGLPAMQVHDAFEGGLDRTLVFPPPVSNVHLDRSDTLRDLPAGTYTVFAKLGYKCIRLEDIVISAGDTAEAKLDFEAPGEVNLVVSWQSQARANSPLVLVPRGGLLKDEATLVETDDNGLATVSLEPGTYAVLTVREHGLKSSAYSNACDSANWIDVSSGDRFEYQCELYRPGTVWLTVEIDAPEDFPILSAQISDWEFDRQGFAKISTYIMDGPAGVFEFGPVPAGAYELLAKSNYTVSGELGNCVLYERLEVRSPPEQTIQISVKLHRLEVQVEPPKDFDGGFKLAIERTSDWPSQLVKHVRVPEASSEKDKFVVEGLPAGRYRVQARSGFRISKSAFVHLSKNGEVTIDFSEVATGVSIRHKNGVDYDEGLIPENAIMWARLLDSDDRVVSVAGLEVTPVEFSSDRTRLIDVSPGDYRLQFYGPGFQSFTTSLVVAAGRETSIELKPVRLGNVRVNLEDVPWTELTHTEVSYTPLDTDGNPIDRVDRDTCEPVVYRLGWLFKELTKSNFRARDARPGIIEFRDIPLNCKRMLVKIEGFKPLELDVELDHSRRMVCTPRIDRS